MKQNRLIRIETSLTPKQAVLMWLRKEHQGKTSDEYLRFLIQRPASFAPRPRIQKQVVETTRAAMKGQDPNRIHQAVRQAQMHADFLILLVNRVNSVIRYDSQARSLKIALVFERLRNTGLSEDESEEMAEWATFLRLVALELFSLKAATELIEQKYFEGECVLLKDILEDLQEQTSRIGKMVNAYNAVVAKRGKPEFAILGSAFQKEVNMRASQTAGYIVALAKSKMLDDLGEHEAADSVIRPYLLDKPPDVASDLSTT